MTDIIKEVFSYITLMIIVLGAYFGEKYHISWMAIFFEVGILTFAYIGAKYIADAFMGED